MDKQALDQSWDQFRQKYGVYLRLLEAIPDDRFDGHPVAGMRTPAELVAHTSGGLVRDITLGIAKGAITADETSEAAVAAGFKTKAAAIDYAKQCWSLAAAAVAKIGNQELSAMVTTPWNMTFPGSFGFDILNDEFLHHRGQLSVYARVCGVEPPFIWGFGDNAPEFRPTT